MALNSLPLFHRIAGQRVVVLGSGASAEAKRRLVERAGGVCCAEPEAHHATLAFVATDDPAEAAAAAIRLRSKGLLVNVTDRPELCDFTVPSILDRDPVIVAVGTGGASAGLAKHLRLRLEALIPQSLGRLADALFAARQSLRERWPDPADRRRALDGALSEGSSLDPLADHSGTAIEGWLAGIPPAGRQQAIEFEVGDDPDDLTLRQARALGAADTVLHDMDVAPAVLDRARADAVRGGIGDPARGLTVILRRRR